MKKKSKMGPMYSVEDFLTDSKRSKWSVLMAGIGVRIVEAEDIDGAYTAAMATYGCRLEDILAVFSHTPFRASN